MVQTCTFLMATQFTLFLVLIVCTVVTAEQAQSEGQTECVVQPEGLAVKLTCPGSSTVGYRWYHNGMLIRDSSPPMGVSFLLNDPSHRSIIVIFSPDNEDMLFQCKPFGSNSNTSGVYIMLMFRGVEILETQTNTTHIKVSWTNNNFTANTTYCLNISTSNGIQYQTCDLPNTYHTIEIPVIGECDSITFLVIPVQEGMSGTASPPEVAYVNQVITLNRQDLNITANLLSFEVPQCFENGSATIDTGEECRECTVEQNVVTCPIDGSSASGSTVKVTVNNTLVYNINSSLVCNISISDVSVDSTGILAGVLGGGVGALAAIGVTTLCIYTCIARRGKKKSYSPPNNRGDANSNEETELKTAEGSSEAGKVLGPEEQTGDYTSRPDEIFNNTPKPERDGPNRALYRDNPVSQSNHNEISSAPELFPAYQNEFEKNETELELEEDSGH